MFCPKCKTNNAFISETYKTDIVCWCGGSKLNLVGRINDNSSIDLSGYKFRRLTQEELPKIGELFKNALSSEYYRNTHTKSLSFYLGTFKNQNDYEYNLLLWVDTNNVLINVEYMNKTSVELRLFEFLYKNWNLFKF